MAVGAAAAAAAVLLALLLQQWWPPSKQLGFLDFLKRKSAGDYSEILPELWGGLGLGILLCNLSMSESIGELMIGKRLIL